MQRKDFLKKGLLGAGALAAVAGVGSLDGKEIKEQPKQVGFNHLPNKKDKLMENITLHKSSTRGYAKHGWLESRHSFSFANYYNPERMNFGALRVLNDDIIDGGTGFGMHPHDNMEIISIPIEGALEHKDSMGNTAVISAGDIQVMSAGTGVFHSEYNKYKDKKGSFLQIWIFPNKRNVEPRYDQITLDPEKRVNKLQQILSPSKDDEGVWINQDAWFHLGTFDEGKGAQYQLKKSGNGVYAFVMKGSFDLGGVTLEERDGLGIESESYFELKALSNDAEILLMEIPMNVNRG